MRPVSKDFILYETNGSFESNEEFTRLAETRLILFTASFESNEEFTRLAETRLAQKTSNCRASQTFGQFRKIIVIAQPVTVNFQSNNLVIITI